VSRRRLIGSPPTEYRALSSTGYFRDGITPITKSLWTRQNISSLLVGESSKARKGISSPRISGLFAEANPLWSSRCVTTARPTPSTILHALRDQPGPKHKTRKPARTPPKPTLMAHKALKAQLPHIRRIGRLRRTLPHIGRIGRLRRTLPHLRRIRRLRRTLPPAVQPGDQARRAQRFRLKLEEMAVACHCGPHGHHGLTGTAEQILAQHWLCD
jgi:hypothetical protein